MAVVLGSFGIWAALLGLPADFFDHHGPTLCLSRLLLDTECPGCGMTRASMHALHLDFATAWHYNRLVVIVLPLLAWLWGREVWEQSLRLGWLPGKRPGSAEAPERA
ncbi:MAG: DUF2752 domain-containing protein [Hymenobacteraceae bacterium]|nr:DUF2752 domain-containing protein [Hymenobacteraceae bacterium]